MSDGTKGWSVVCGTQEKVNVTRKRWIFLHFLCCTPALLHVQKSCPNPMAIGNICRHAQTKNTWIWAPMADCLYSKLASTPCSARLPSWAALLVTMLACARTLTSVTVSVTAPTLFALSQLMPPLQPLMVAASVLSTVSCQDLKICDVARLTL
jgi:hypothetical protein